MKDQNVLKLWLCLIVSCCMVWIQCSMIGYHIGGSIGAEKKTVSIPGWEVQEVTPGTDLEIVLMDGNMIRGTYSGLQVMPNSMYEEKYNISRNMHASCSSLPDLNDFITIQLPSCAKDKCRFKGFSCKTYKNLLAYSVAVRRENRSRDSQYDLQAIAGFQVEGGDFFDSNQLHQILQKDEIPVNKIIIIDDGLKTHTVPFNEVYQIRKQVKTMDTGGAIAGLLLGGTVDVLVISVIVKSLDSNKPKPVQTYSSDVNMQWSCPFIYSYNGNEFIRDSETFGGAIFEAAQRTDWDNLDYLEDVQGQYNLKITNELLETQYVDEMKLLVIDHPIGSKVMPTFTGQLQVLLSPQKPQKAEDFSGVNILELIDKKDDQVWVGNPFYRNPDDKKQARDGMNLEFNKPEGAQSVKLAVNVQNTLWSSYLQGRMLTLQGDELKNWYALLNQSAEARKEFMEVMIREGMLLVKVWNGKEWRYADFIWEVGPSVPKDQVVRLNISDIPGSILKIKLESTTGFWMVNCVQADYSVDSPIQVHELNPCYAKNHMGEDILNTIDAVDHQYYIMPKFNSWADVKFDALPVPDGCERSYILKCNGYYTIDIESTGDPRYDLITKFMNEPVAYGQYTVDMLQKFTEQYFAQNGDMNNAF